MSAFAYYEKDEIVEAIRAFAAKESESGASQADVVASILEAVTYGIREAIAEMEEGNK